MERKVTESKVGFESRSSSLAVYPSQIRLLE